jgi:periplasmic divalent cation tolerance protein
MSELLRVSTATPDQDTAKALARSAVEARLAGNAQILGPVASVFRHLGESGEGEEWQLVLATTAAAYPALEAHLSAQHPWSNPEITAVDITRAPDSYRAWLTAATAPEA